MSKSALYTDDALGKQSLFITLSRLYIELDPSDEEEIAGLGV